MTREKAIDIVKRLAWHRRPSEEDIQQAIEELENGNTSEWVRSYDRVTNSWYYECLNCDKGTDQATEYCPHCGKKMKRRQINGIY